MSTTVRIWIHGIIAALIGGGANSVVGVVSAGWVLPNQVNTGAGLHTALALMGVQFAFGGAISVALYLKQSPVPADWITPKQEDAKPSAS
jgi:hypothetical protein